MSEKPQQKTPDVSRETKNKPSSFYLYLIVLFGAAFLMLLLAYFVQKRNNETAISELRSTMNLSRGELMEQIETLEAEMQALEEEKEGLQTRLSDLQAENAELEAQLDAARNDPVVAEQKNRADVLTLFAILEQALRDKNYEVAANQVRALCQGDLKLDLGLVNVDGSEYFYPAARLSEIIPLLEKRGALAPGEVVIP